MLENPPEPPRARRRSKNVRRIIDAATEAIATGGIDALSMNRLAATLDYTPGALYRYFPSKDALVAAIVVELVDEIGGDVARVAEAAAARPPLVRVVACAAAWRRFARDDPHRFSLLAMLLAVPRMVLTDESHAATAIAAMIGATRPLSTALAEAATDGALAPLPAAARPFDRAILVFSGLLGVLVLRKQAQRAPDLIDLDRLFAGMLSALLIGWGAAPDAVADALADPVAHLDPAPRAPTLRSPA